MSDVENSRSPDSVLVKSVDSSEDEVKPEDSQTLLPLLSPRDQSMQNIAMIPIDINSSNIYATPRTLSAYSLSDNDRDNNDDDDDIDDEEEESVDINSDETYNDQADIFLDESKLETPIINTPDSVPQQVCFLLNPPGLGIIYLTLLRFFLCARIFKFKKKYFCYKYVK